ncbi:MAG: DUF2958 domain-containing protein [Rickettsiales bacterium]|nr:DUF2958 domain-containing protein [Rickettsiales bacterium]
MKLITEKLLTMLPPLYANEEKDQKDVKVIAKFFNPSGAQTWYATEFDPIEKLFFGFVNLGWDDIAELGYFRLDELEEIKGCFGLGIERDLHWNPETSLADVMNFKVR